MEGSERRGAEGGGLNGMHGGGCRRFDENYVVLMADEWRLRWLRLDTGSEIHNPKSV